MLTLALTVAAPIALLVARPRATPAFWLVIIALAAFAGFQVRGLLAEGAIVSSPEANAQQIRWQPLSEAAIQSALADGKRVFIDISADWCVTCKVNEHRVLNQPAIISALAEPDVARCAATEQALSRSPVSCKAKSLRHSLQSGLRSRRAARRDAAAAARSTKRPERAHSCQRLINDENYAAHFSSLGVVDGVSLSPLTPAQEARVQALVQETLLSHPEILIAAADKLDRQNARAEQESLKQVLSQYGDFLFHDPHSPRIGAQSRS
jgi:hypothetical protein